MQSQTTASAYLSRKQILPFSFSRHLRGHCHWSKVECYTMVLELAATIQMAIRSFVQVTIYRRLRIGRDGHLDQSEACDTL